jgi:hypothetical protein
MELYLRSKSPEPTSDKKASSYAASGFETETL